MTEQISGTKRPRLDALTSLRFFAAFLVFLFHYARDFSLPADWLVSLSSHGFAAVTFFFVLSGFILTYTHLDVEQPGHFRGTRPSFWVSRFARIYPLYLAALLVGLPAYLYAAVHGRSSFSGSLLGLGLIPTMVQAWIPSAAIDWNPPAWSLSVEAAFYSLFPFLMARVGRWDGRKLLLLSFALIWLTSALNDWLWVLKVDNGGPIDYNWRNFLFYFPPFHLPVFLLGMALGQLVLMSSATRMRLYRWGLWTGLVAVGGIAAGRQHLPAFLYSRTASAVLFSAIIYCGAMVRRDPVLGTPLLVRLGDASYAMYILQAPLSGWFEFVLKRLCKVEHWTQSYWFVAAFLLILVVASWLSLEYLEKPCRRAIQAWFKCPTTNTPRPVEVIA